MTRVALSHPQSRSRSLPRSWLAGCVTRRSSGLSWLPTPVGSPALPTVRETRPLRSGPISLTSPSAADQAVLAFDAAGAEAAVAVLADGTLTSVSLDAAAADLADLTRPMRRVVPTTAHPSGALASADVRRWVALGLTGTTADLVGTMQGALDLTVEYAKERRQYGVPIGSFQAVAHMLADASVHLEGARTTLLHAAWAVDALDAEDALAAAASAKAYASRAAREVCETAIQVHGGIGNTWECLAHVYLRRSLVSTAILGGVGPNLERVLDHAGIRECDGLL